MARAYNTELWLNAQKLKTLNPAVDTYLTKWRLIGLHFGLSLHIGTNRVRCGCEIARVRFDVLGSVGKQFFCVDDSETHFGLCIHFVSPPSLSNVDVTLFVCDLTSWVTLGFGKYFVVNIFADGGF